jgi:lipopolysaccharide export system protein LptA
MTVRADRRFRSPRIAVRTAVLVLAVAAAGEAAAQKSVQAGPNAMQGFSQNRDQPIQIEAGALEMREKKKEATFSGNVKVVQGDTTMTSKSLVAFYDQNAPLKSATPGPGGSSSIRRLEAKGGVVVIQKDQVVSGKTAVFDTRTNLITMLGGIVLTQCRSVMRGDRLAVDMTTGVSRIESDTGKVQVLLIQGQGCASPIPGAPPSGSPSGATGANKPK